MNTTHLIALDAVDHELGALTRDWFEHDLRSRIDAALDRRLALLLSGDSSVHGRFSRAA